MLALRFAVLRQEWIVLPRPCNVGSLEMASNGELALLFGCPYFLVQDGEWKMVMVTGLARRGGGCLSEIEETTNPRRG